MAYRAPVFYFYNAGRDGASMGGSFSYSSALTTGSDQNLIDSLQSGAVTLTDDLVTTTGIFKVPIDNTTNGQSVDALIVSGHNFGGADVSFSAGSPDVDLVSSNPVAPANGTAFVIDADQNTPYTSKTNIFLAVFSNGPEDAIVPSVTELFFTQARQMTRGPTPDWDHPWVRSQQRFETAGGITQRWQTGAARKVFEMTWENLSGADLQIMLDMREQTAHWSHPFWLLPPDDEYDLLFVEVVGESRFRQQRDLAEVVHTVTLSMREVLG